MNKVKGFAYSLLRDVCLLRTREGVAAWLDKRGITDYKIYKDLSVCVKGDVMISSSTKSFFDFLPINFRHVSGSFNCRYNKLKSLEGCPIKVGGSFDCSGNNLITLKGCPIEIGGSFDCRTNKLTSLEYCPAVVVNFDCCSNDMRSLVCGPTLVSGYYYCINNGLNSLLGCPVAVGGNFNCSSNNLSSLEFCPANVGGNCSFIANKLVESEEFLYNCDVEKIGNYYRSKNLNNKLTKSLVDVQEVVVKKSKI